MSTASIYKIALSMLPGLGPVSARNLIAMFGSSEKVFTLKGSHLKRIDGIGNHFAESIIKNREKALKMAEEEATFMNKNKIKYVSFTDTDYPKRLKNCQDAPVILYYKGTISDEAEKSIAIVGTRKATSRGRDATEKLVKDLKEKQINPLIISGLAYGIDIYSHHSAMQNELTTWAVLGHGFDIIYPAVHREASEKIIDKGGAVISEYPSSTKRDPKHFVRRNRIIAGLSDATVIVESAKKGGAMITADIASSYNRDVFAFPGRIHDNKSKGCNHLIKTNRAALIESADDIIYNMNWETTNKKAKPEQKEISFNIKFNDIEEKIVNILSENDYSDIDQLVKSTGTNVTDLSMALLSLEINSVIKALPGKIYSLKRN